MLNNVKKTVLLQQDKIQLIMKMLITKIILIIKQIAIKKINNNKHLLLKYVVIKKSNFINIFLVLQHIWKHLIF